VGGRVNSSAAGFFHVQVTRVGRRAGAREGLVRSGEAWAGASDEIEFDGVSGLHPRLQRTVDAVAQLFSIDVTNLGRNVVAMIVSSEVVMDMRCKFDVCVLLFLPHSSLLAADYDQSH